MNFYIGEVHKKTRDGARRRRFSTRREARYTARLLNRSRALKFEHVVVVNDPDNPLVQSLSREQLWFGLLCRAEKPGMFLPGLDRCEIIERHADRLVRRLHFGAAVIDDSVRLAHLESVMFESAATAEHPGGTLTIRIEEPAETVLVLRFTYRTSLPDDAQDPDGAYAGFIRSAYHASDLDTVQVIRSIAATGRPQ